MKQVCLQCGAEYTEPTGWCTATVMREVVVDSDFVYQSFQCGSRQWSYPADPQPVPDPAPTAPESPSAKADQKPAKNK